MTKNIFIGEVQFLCSAFKNLRTCTLVITKLLNDEMRRFVIYLFVLFPGFGGP